MSPSMALMRRAASEATIYKEQLELPGWGIALLAVTFAVYVIASSMISYTFGRLIPTLVMVESPADSITFEPLPTDDTDATLNKNLASNLEPVQPKPITSSFRTTLAVLKSKGGFRSRFRGISAYIVTGVAINWAAQFLSTIPFFPRALGVIGASVVCAQLSTAWTHIVISDPSPKFWFRRIPSVKQWKKVAGPTAVLALAEQVAVMLPLGIGMACGLGEKVPNPNQIQKYSNRDASMLFFGASGLGLLALALSILLVIPADVALTRVQASLLSDAEETVVPFDRSFGGKVIPEIVGGTGVIGMLDAWKTFDWNARTRLVKAYAKVFLMEFALGLTFAVLAFGELAIALAKSKKVADGEPDATVELM